MDHNLEKECNALGGLFQVILHDVKGSFPIWEDFAIKANKLHQQLKVTASTFSAFLDGLQSVADIATGTKGGTRDIGTSLTRICMRHRSIENRLKTLNAAIADCMTAKLQESLEDWRRTSAQLDKEHAKEFKRQRADVKKRSVELGKIEKKLRKQHNLNLSTNSSNHQLQHAGGTPGSASAACLNGAKAGNDGAGPAAAVTKLLETAGADIRDRQRVLLEAERTAVRAAMTEQRSHFCHFVSWFKPVLESEMAMLDEVEMMQDIFGRLLRDSQEPHSLPPASEAVLEDIKGLENVIPMYRTPPSSPGGSLGSRKSSFCSLNSTDSDMNHLNAPTSSAGISNINHAGGVSQQHQYLQFGGRATHSSGGVPIAPANAPTVTPTSPTKFSSVGSADSGFVSHDPVYGPLVAIGGSTTTDKESVFRATFVGSTIPGSTTPESNAGFMLGGTDGQSQQSTPSPSPSSATWPDVPGEYATLGYFGPPGTRNLGYGSDGPHNRTVVCGSMVANCLPNPSTSDSTGTPRAVTLTGSPYDSRTIKRKPLNPATFVPPFLEGVAGVVGGYLPPSDADLRNVDSSRSPLMRPRSLYPGHVNADEGNKTGNKHSSSSKGKNGKKNSSESAGEVAMPSTSSASAFTPSVPDFNQQQPDQYVPQPIYVSANELAAYKQKQLEACHGLSSLQRPGSQKRPSSFVADDETYFFINSEQSSSDPHSVETGSINGGGGISATTNSGTASRSSASLKGSGDSSPSSDVPTARAASEEPSSSFKSTASPSFHRTNAAPQTTSSDDVTPQSTNSGQSRPSDDPCFYSNHGELLRERNLDCHAGGAQTVDNNNANNSSYALIDELSGKPQILLGSVRGDYAFVIQQAGTRHSLAPSLGNAGAASVPSTPIYQALSAGSLEVAIRDQHRSTSVSEPWPPHPQNISTSQQPSPVVIRQSQPQKVGDGGIGMGSRRQSLVSNGSMGGPKPPPPVRRNSAITSATSAAPPIDQVRASSRATTPLAEEYYPPSANVEFDSNEGAGGISCVVQNLNIRMSINAQLRAAMEGTPLIDNQHDLPPMGVGNSPNSAGSKPGAGSIGSNSKQKGGYKKKMMRDQSPPSFLKTRDSSLPPRVQSLNSSNSAASSASSGLGAFPTTRETMLQQIRNGISHHRKTSLVKK